MIIKTSRIQCIVIALYIHHLTFTEKVRIGRHIIRNGNGSGGLTCPPSHHLLSLRLGFTLA